MPDGCKVISKEMFQDTHAPGNLDFALECLVYTAKDTYLKHCVFKVGRRHVIMVERSYLVVEGGIPSVLIVMSCKNGFHCNGVEAISVG